MKRAIGLVLLWCLVIPLRANLRPAWIFQDHAVLQRDRPVAIWGDANPGEGVTVVFRDHRVEGVADAAGRWRVTLPPLQANSEGASLEIRAGEDRVTLRDVVVGDVWLCAGQSNMEWNVARAKDAKSEMAAAKHPLIRHIKVANFSSRTPLQEARGGWRVCGPDTVGNFTAVGYHFARELVAAQGVPVGIINCSWGGTPIEAWMSEQALLESPHFDVVFARWGEAVTTFPERMRDFKKWTEEKRLAEERGETLETKRVRDPALDYRRQPAGLFGGMIAPVGSYALRGVAWYQGEDNASRAGEYARLLEVWVGDWRRQWPEIPMLLIQLPNFASGNADGISWTRIREAQARVAERSPGVTLVTTIDLGDANDVHPRDKRSVGVRLALAARAAVYGENLVASGPTLRGIEAKGNVLVCTFADAEGLIMKAGAREFAVAGADRRFFPAEATLVGEEIHLVAGEVSAPVAARYAWRNAPEAAVFNRAGFPLAPFRTDDWPHPGEEAGAIARPARMENASVAPAATP